MEKKKGKIEIKEIEKKNQFIKVINQLMLRMTESYIAEGPDGVEVFTDFDRRIVKEIFENPEYKKEIKEKNINEDNIITIGSMLLKSGTYLKNNEVYDYEYSKDLEIECLENGLAKLIIREQEGICNNLISDNKEKITDVAIIEVEKLQEFCDSLPVLYPGLDPELPEEMADQFFNDNGRLSKEEIQGLLKETNKKQKQRENCNEGLSYRIGETDTFKSAIVEMTENSIDVNASGLRKIGDMIQETTKEVERNSEEKEQ